MASYSAAQRVLHRTRLSRSSRGWSRTDFLSDRQPQELRQGADAELAHQARSPKLDGAGRDDSNRVAISLFGRPSLINSRTSRSFSVSRSELRQDDLAGSEATAAIDVVLDRALDLVQEGLAVERLLDKLDGAGLHRADRHRDIGITR